MSDDYQVAHRAPGDDGYSRPIVQARDAFGEAVKSRPQSPGVTARATAQVVAERGAGMGY